MDDVIWFVVFMVLMVGMMIVARDAGLQAEKKKATKVNKTASNVASEVYAEFITNVMIDAMVPGKKH